MKKFLSLVLALIMTMSLVTISAGATEYRDLTDKEEIQYEEAVAVLNRIGVITGYEDGSFRPETELTRGAAAKIIVSLMIGPDAAAALPNNASPYPDVPAGHTFAGVIGYCKTAGYISGYGDGTFKPANPLTGYAFAKMLLGAVGYKANIEGFVDTGWTMNVARIGNVAGLFDRLDFDGAAAVTRDEACQLALNTLKATMVDYGGANTVVSSTGEVLTVQGSKAQYVTSNNRDINANINRRVISATNNELTLEFGEEHFKDLRLEHDKYDPAYDVYGHPSNEWSYKKVTIGTFPLEADFTFTKQMAHIEDSVASKEKALGLRGYDTYSTDHRGGFVNWNTASSDKYTSSPFADATQIVVNGWNARVRNDDYKQGTIPASAKDEGDLFTYDAYEIDKDSKTLAPSIAEICDLTDNGVTVEVYVCPVDADFITHVVVTRTQLMKIDRLGSDYVTLNKEKPDSRGKSLDQLAGYNDNAIDVDVVDVKDSNYDAYNVLKELKSGDRVAVVPYTTDDGKTWEVGEAYVPETVTGKLTRVDIYNNEKVPEGNSVALTVGGTSYPMNQWNKGMLKVDADQIKATRKDVAVYLAKDGTALWADEIGNSDDWMIVGDYYQATNSSGKVVWFAHGWTIGGDEVDVDLGTIRGEAEKYAPGELVQYKIASGGNGEYELRKPSYTGASVKKNYYKTVEPEDAVIPTEAIEEVSLDKHEGVYSVAQKFIYTNSGLQPYSIRKVNAQIPVDRYNVAEDGSSEAGIVVTPANENPTFDWKYTNLYYESPTFVYVGFDSVTGEVETITFVDGKQDVDNGDLTASNTYWRNVGTNDDNFVATAAEAYVNDEGKVTTVVIKNDSHEADLSNIRIITKYKGSNNYVGAEGDVELSGKYYEREYVFGPDFKEETTGTFDKNYRVGDILTGTEKNGVFYGKKFHGSSYSNKSLDGFYVKGIKTVTTPLGDVIDDYVIIDKDNRYLATLDREHSVTPGSMDIFTNTMVLGDDALVGEEGLILCGGAKIIDVRIGHEGEITKLADLFDDYDLGTVELKILLNGNSSSTNFRQAYAIVILSAELTKSKAAVPAFGITVDGKDAWDADAKGYKVTASVGDELDLGVKLTNESKLTNVSYEWEIDEGKLAGDKKSDEVSFTAKSEGTYKVTVTVTNKDTSKEIEESPVTQTLTIVVGKGAPAESAVILKNNAPTLQGASLVDGRVALGANNKADLRFTITVPEFVSTSTAGSNEFTADVYVNGGTQPSESITTAVDFSALNAGKLTFSGEIGTVANYGAADEFKVEITSFTFEGIKVQFVDEAGDPIEDSRLFAEDAVMDGTGNGVEVGLNSSAASGAVTFTYKSGLDTTASATKTLNANGSTNDSNKADLFSTEVEATGDNYVKVEVTGLDSLTEKISVVGADGDGEDLVDGTGLVMAPAAKKIGLFFVDDIVTTPVAADSVTVSVYAWYTEAPSGEKVTVSVKGPDGQTIGTSGVLSANGKDKAVKVGEVTLTETWTISKDDVTVVAAETPEVSSASFDGAKLTVTMNTPVAIVDGKSPVDVLAVTTGTSAALTFVEESIHVDGDTITATAASWTAGTTDSSIQIKFVESKDAFKTGIGTANAKITINKDTLACTIGAGA